MQNLRIEPKRARDELAQGALLVCAYDDAQKYDQFHLNGAMSFHEFQGRAASIPKTQEIIFYCA